MSRHWSALTQRPEAKPPEPDEFDKLPPEDQVYLTWWITGARPPAPAHPEMYAGAEDVVREAA